MADFTPTSGMVWTQNHNFSFGGEVNFSSAGSAIFDQPIEVGVGGIQVLGGSINYNVDQQQNPSSNNRTTLLVRMAIIGDPAGGDGGAGAGSVLIVNVPLYVRGGENARYDFNTFVLQFEKNRIPVPPDGSPYRFVIQANAVGDIWPTHMEISLAGVWWGQTGASAFDQPPTYF
jgi:hypothetical protein